MAGVRRTWDKDLYAEKARERLDRVDEDEPSSSSSSRKASIRKEEFQAAAADAAGPMGSQRAFLNARKDRVDTESKVGKTEIVNPEHADRGAGYWCEVCACMLKDSTSYLDHINGKKHQRALGFSMRVERADVTQVKDRISSLKRRIEEQKSRPQKSASDSYEERLAASVAEEEARKKRRKDEKKKLEEIQDDEAEAVDPEIAAMMGFGGFGGGK